MADNGTTETLHPKLDLFELNQQEAYRRLPVVIFIGILSFAGIIGNAHVLYIYNTCFKTSTYRVFVLSLCIIDIICCCVSMPFEMIDELFPLSYSEIITCKVFRFINTCVAVASAFMLILIASERYRRVCRPYGSQMSETTAIYSSIGVVVLAIVFTCPAIYVYGRKTIPDLPVPGHNVSVYNITGYECTWGDHMDDTLYGYLYYAWVLLSIVGSMVILTVLYSIIGVTLRKHNKVMRLTLRKKQTSHVILSQNLESEYQGENRGMKQALGGSDDENVKNEETVNQNLTGGTNELLLPDVNMRHAATKEVKHGLSATGNNIVSSNLKVGPETGVRISDRKSSTGSSYSATNNRVSQLPLTPRKATINMKEQRITKVLFTITVLFICSFLPYIIVLIAYSVSTSYAENLNTTELILILIGFRLYMINSVANSILYGFFDEKFRKHVKRLYQRIFDRCRRLVPGKSH